MADASYAATTSRISARDGLRGGSPRTTSCEGDDGQREKDSESAVRVRVRVGPSPEFESESR
eukprot:5046167-Pyramimonas_sp.AAC.1